MEPSGPPPDDRPDVIVFTFDGSGPPPFHVRDQEALVAALPPCAVAPADRARLAPVAFGPYPATVWLPDAGAAEPADVPEGTCQGWEWLDGAFLSIMVHRHAGLPGLYALVGYAPDACRAELAGRPVAVTLAPPGSPEPDGSGVTADHRAQVGGYLDDHTSVWADVAAPTAAGRDRLLAALFTLTPTPPPEPAGSRAAA